MCDAEIGVDDGLILLDLIRRAVSNLHAMIEHHHAMGEIHHHSHVVLDQRDGCAVMVVYVDDEPRHVLLLFEVHACHRLVEEKKIGLHRKGATGTFRIASISRKSTISSTRCRCSISSASAGP